MKIKSLLGTVLLVSLSITSVIAQTDNTSGSDAKQSKPIADEFHQFNIGVFGDATLSWMKPDMDIANVIQYNTDGLRLVAGWGLFFDYNFTENYTFSTGFRFGGSGGKLAFIDSISTTGNVYRTYKFQYVEIPLDLKLKTNQIGFFTYFFQIGLRPGFRMKATAEDKFDGTNFPNRIMDLKSNDETSFIQMGFQVGIGAEYQISKSFSAFASLNYRNGLIDVLKGTNSIDATLEENALIKGVALTAGFIF